MKSALTLVLFLAASAFAQDQAALTAAEATCGPKNVKFDATEDETHHPTPQPEPGKALVYVIQDMGLAQCNDCALTKVGSMAHGWERTRVAPTYSSPRKRENAISA